MFDVTLLDVTLRGRTGKTIPALAYPHLVGPPQPGDRVLLNVGALERGLGTGGLALIVAIPDRLPPDPEASPGHIIKARYTPLQTMVLGVDEQESPHHEVLRDATRIDAMPVIMADLHSAVPAILAALRGSEADERERHRGISHHSLTTYGRVAMASADLPVPLLGGEFGERVLEQARRLATDSAGRLRLREVDVSGLVEVLASSPVRLSTMGRGLDE